MILNQCPTSFFPSSRGEGEKVDVQGSTSAAEGRMPWAAAGSDQDEE